MKTLEFTKFPALGYAGEEAFNTLCVNLSFAGDNVRKIMVTSCQASEGKSYVTMNLMRKFAHLGNSVVFVDADLRRSMIRTRYGVEMGATRGNKGLAHYLAGKCDISEVLYETNISGAYMVPVGREIENSLRLLTGPKLSHLLDELAKNFEIVLVDAPPVGVIVDAAEIAKSCDGTLFVVGYNKTRRGDLNSAKEQIERAGCPVIGSVLNDVTFDSLSSRKYYYKSYYSSHYSGYYKKDDTETSESEKPRSKKKA